MKSNLGLREFYRGMAYRVVKGFYRIEGSRRVMKGVV